MHGSVPEGALCALMGPSGGGKTTLLDLLTGRKDYGRCEGQVLFQGVSIGGQKVRASVEQSETPIHARVFPLGFSGLDSASVSEIRV